MATCQKCGQRVCADDAVSSQFRAETYCSAHAATFEECPGCGRSGPASQLKKCSHCEVSYCPHCVGKGAEQCTHCDNLEELTLESEVDRWAEAVRDSARPSAISEADWAEVQSALGDYRCRFHWTFSDTHRHHLLRGTIEGWWGLVWTVKTLLIVLDGETGGVSIRINLSNP